PCEMEEGRREKNLASWGNMSDLAGKWILLAEDNRINQEVISRILTSYGMCVILAGDGQETLKIYQENEDRIDLILMDVVMLNMNGLEATRQIRSLPSEKAKTVPVIAITADTLRRSLSTELRESGINAYLYKPLEPEVLIQEIRTFI
ncbi:MAG: response regulator, partial [Lachnospiraceae bacterium]|nr:response regulator [Lachnospiraceae bacterium]